MSELALIRSSPPTHNTGWFDYMGVFVLLGLIFGQQIVMVIPLFMGVSTTPFSIAFRALILMISLLLCLRIVLFPSRFIWNRNVVLLMVFLLIYSLRLIYDLYIVEINISPSLGGPTKLSQFYFGSILLPILGCSVIKYDVRRLQILFFIASVLQCLAISYIFFSIYGISSRAFVSRHYIASIFSNSDIGQPIGPIIISRSGGVLIICTFFVQGISKWLKSFTVLLGLVLLFMGSSRGPMLATLVCLLIGTISYVKRGSFEKIILKVFILIGAIILLFFKLGSILNNADLGAINRMTNTIETGGEGEERLVIWTGAWRQFLESPIIGDKIVDNFANTYPHNIILEILMSVGLLGFVPFLVILLLAIIRIVNVLNTEGQLFAMLFVFSFISMMVSGSIALSPYFWVVFMLVLTIFVKK